MKEEKDVVKMTTKKEENKTNQKLSYEELEKFAYQLSEQAKQLTKALNEKDNVIKQLRTNIAEITNAFTRLNFLIEIVKNSNIKFDSEFAKVCADEVKNLMTIPEEEESKEEK